MTCSLWTRREFLRRVGLGAGALSFFGGCRAVPSRPNTPARQRPNVILILVDDMGWTDAACYHSRYYQTPNIDRLARQGMRFTDAYAACAVCSPTRAAVMTGRYPARLGVTDWIRSRFQGGAIPADQRNPSQTQYVGGRNRKLLCPANALWMEHQEITLAEALKPAGYTCCHIGKWHLGPDDWYPDKQGFDYNIGGCDYGQPPSYFDPYYRKGQGQIPTLPPRREGEYLTDREADEAVRFISDHRERPFFLYLAHYAVHQPIQAKKELIEKYRAVEPTRQKNPIYAAMIESVDQALGNILQTLDDLDLASDTLILFTSDNGGLLGPTDNAPLRAGKGYPYEGGIREPLVVRWPGVVPAGSTCAEPVTSVDFFPTICAATGAALPADRPIDGENLLPLLIQGGSLGPRALYWHFPHYRGRDVVPYSIVRRGDWKLIKRYEGRTFELYNLKQDLSENHDLAEAEPSQVEQLDALLTAWLLETNAKLPRPNPDYQPPDSSDAAH